MKKKIVTLLLIALVLAVTLTTFCGCFFQNLSIFSSSGMDEDTLAALDTLAAEDEDDPALANFSQINKVSLSMGANSIQIINEYKVTENGIYVKQYSSDSASGSAGSYEYYLEKDRGEYFLYMPNPSDHSRWRVGNISQEQWKQYVNLSARNSSISADSRSNLFSAKNYKKSGDHYKYVGPKVYITIETGSSSDTATFVFDVDGLFLVENGVEIKGNVAPEMTEEQKKQMKEMGYTFDMPYSYCVYNVGTTKITSYPSVENPEYKDNFFAAKEAENNRNQDNEESGKDVE